MFEGRASLHPLRTSYRSTAYHAVRLARGKAAPGVQALARPVLRCGETPGLGFETEKARTLCGRQRRAVFAGGLFHRRHHRPDAKRCAALCKALPKSLQARLLHAGDTQYGGGLTVLPASLVKGLEFDCVILADASETAYPDTELDARLLYVCLTRPLHKLLCCHVGPLTPLLAQEEGGTG